MSITIYPKTNLCDIDRLGEIKAQIADMQAIADGLADSIKAMGAGKHDGELFSATVTVVDEASVADPKAIAAKLKELMGEKAFASFCKANEKKRAGYTALKLNARD